MNMTKFTLWIDMISSYKRKGLVKDELGDGEKRYVDEYVDELVGFVEASIGRMVPVMTPEMQEGNILRICTEEYGELPVDRDGFKGEIPDIKGMIAFSPFEYYIQRKIFIHNMGHVNKHTFYLRRP